MLASATHLPSVVPQAPRIARNAFTLLLVDDTDAVRDVLEIVLGLEGYRVVTASSGEAALEIASRTRFDMLITDFEMPGMNGYALAAVLNDRNPTLPVLVISGADHSRLPLAEMERRRWHFLPKPLQNTRLLQITDHSCLSQGVAMEQRGPEQRLR